jgi:hypothetical protein
MSGPAGGLAFAACAERACHHQRYSQAVSGQLRELADQATAGMPLTPLVRRPADRGLAQAGVRSA